MGTQRTVTDHLGRSVTVIDDVTARMLYNASHVGWTEFRGMADGYSRTYPEGHPVHDAALELFAHTAIHGHTYLMVGESGWSDETSWWVDYPASRELHPLPPVRGRGGIYFAG
jgi:hypothetical protein